MRIFLRTLMLCIFFFSVENSFSLEEITESKEKRNRPTWNNQVIQPRLKIICSIFYQGKAIPYFLESFRTMLKINRANANKFLDESVSHFNITTSIDSIEDLFDRFNIIALRSPTKEKLILSCGNYITDIECKYYKNHCGKDIHPDADTVDINIGMNPTIVADLSSSEFYEYLINLNKRYDEIVAEGGYTLHGFSGLQKLRKILNVNGVYKLEVGTMFTVINASKEMDFKDSLKNDRYFSLLLPQEKYQELLSIDPDNVANILREEMGKFYEQNGFILRIQHPESFTLRRIDSGKDHEISHAYSIDRAEVEAAVITLIRVR